MSPQPISNGYGGFMLQQHNLFNSKRAKNIKNPLLPNENYRFKQKRHTHEILSLDADDFEDDEDPFGSELEQLHRFADSLLSNKEGMKNKRKINKIKNSLKQLEKGVQEEKKEVPSFNADDINHPVQIPYQL